MPVYEFGKEAIRPLERSTFAQSGLHERRDMQRLLRENISVIAPETLVISEEFGDWADSRRRIDLLAIDRDANLVVIELKRTEDGGHMELQAIRYAAMVSTLTFDRAVDVYCRHLAHLGKAEIDARSGLLDFLGWEEPDEEAFAQDVRIVLASAEFGRELTTSALWLRDRKIDVRCVRLQPYALGDRLLVDVQQIIPLPEAAEYQVRVSEKHRKEREARSDGRDWTSYDLTLDGRQTKALRKRNAMYLTFRHLVKRGVSPEEIVRHFQRGERTIVSVEGEVSAGDFVRIARQAKAEAGASFDQRRFFCDDGETVFYSGRTYALTSQWGDPRWTDAMTKLRDAFPDHQIEFSPHVA